MSERAFIDYDKLAKEAPAAIENAENGLPDEVFSFVSSVTPMVNVDLLVVRDGKILLAWRDDGRNLGWHIPGGIVRFKESFHERIIKTAERELGTEVEYKADPIKISEIKMWYQRRGHFISFLHECCLPENYEIDNKDLSEKDDGFLKWFDHEPDNLVEGQKCYKGFLREYLRTEELEKYGK